MKRLALASLLVVMATGSWAFAQKPEPAPPNASAAPSAASSASPTEKPPEKPPEKGQLPPGHPPADADHGDAQPRRIPDRVMPDDKLAPGTVDIIILDGNDQPIPNIPFTLDVLFSSVTKGDSRESLPAQTNEAGVYHFENLKYGSGISYRVTVDNGPASFGSQPFGLTDQAGMRVIQHRYDAVTSLAESDMLLELILLLDIKQDNIAVNHLLRAYNRGNTAYVATDVRIPFPEDYAAFSAQESPGGVEMVENEGAMELRGTFPPGQTDITYRYQIPLDGGAEVAMTVPTPPRMAITHVVLKANDEMVLNVTGFPASEDGRWNDGAKVKQTSRVPQTMPEIQAVMSNTSPGKLAIHISGIPTPGLKRTIAVVLALLAMAAGGLHVYRRRTDPASPELDVIEDLEQAEKALLDELALLEKLRAKGDVGPRTYDGLKNQLLDALARIMSRLESARRRGKPAVEAPTTKRSKKRKKRARASVRA